MSRPDLPPTISIERANGHRMAAQGLWPREADLGRVLERVGWLPSRESAYLVLAARLTGFCRSELDRLIFTERRWVELGCLRRQSFVLPREMAAAALRCPAPAEREAAEEGLGGAGVPLAGRVALRDAVVDALTAGALEPNELRGRLDEGRGAAAVFLRMPGVLGAVLTQELQLEGRVVRTCRSGRLDRGMPVLMLTEELLPEIDAPALDMEEALRTLCAYYFRVHGPATAADFGWWSGAGQQAAAAAFEAHRDRLVEVRLAGVPFSLHVTPSRLAEIREWEPEIPESVALAPWRDPWLTSHEGLLGRFVRRKDRARVLPGPALPAILVAGAVAGRWVLQSSPARIELHWIHRVPDRVRIRAEALARELAGTIAAEVGPLPPLAVPSPEGEVPVYA